MNKLLWHSSLALATAASLTACGDDITEITKTGIESVNAYENLAKCEDKNDGEMVFVKDSGAVYLCSDKKWNDINGKDGADGKDGTNGKNGDNGKDGKNGNDGKSAYEIAKENGFKGTETEWLKSLKGEFGEGCTAKSVENGVEITCGNSEPVVVHNGTNGTNASDDCKITDDKDGVITLNCTEGEYILIKKLYKAFCGETPYDPETHFCFDNKQVVSLCKGKEYNPENEFCAKKSIIVDGIYKMVKIGQQTWMANNLSTPTLESKCGGGNGTEEGDCSKYGRLYHWADAVGMSNSLCGNGKKCNLASRVQGICPDGWHLPSQAELEILINVVNTSTDPEKNDAGLHLKANSDLWIDYKDQNKVTQSGAGDNTSGFTALPSGQYSADESKFKFNGEAAYFWSSTEISDGSAYSILVVNDDNIAHYGGSFGKDIMYSVRCIQDTP